MNLLDRMCYDTGGYTVQEILSSFSKKILEIIDLVNKNEELCDDARTLIENIRNEVVPPLVDDIIKEMQDSDYFDNLVNVTLIENLRTELTALLNGAITDCTTKINKLRNNTNIIMSVKEFGAKGDGVTDDTKAIGDCLAYCVENKKTMYFPNGVYCVTHGFLPVPSKNHASKNNLVSIVGESHLGVTFKRIGTGEDPYIFDFKWCNKVYAENLASADFSINTLDNEAYWQGSEQWALALREKDFYLKNLIYTGDGGATSYYTYINSPCPKDYTRYSDGNYAKYPLEITSGSGYNAININNFATNEDGSIGEPQDNSAIGIVDRVNNSTGAIFIDMIGNRSFERYVNRNGEIVSEIRPLTVWEVNQSGHLAIGCSTDVNDPVAKGYETIKMRDKSPQLALIDVNADNKKAILGMFKQSYGEELSLKLNGKGISIVEQNDGSTVISGLKYSPIANGLNVQNNEGTNDGLILTKGDNSVTLYLDNNNDLRIGVTGQENTEGAKLMYNNGGNTGSRPTLTNHWRDVGAMYFDTTINKPIWWNGTKWVDSTGGAV